MNCQRCRRRKIRCDRGRPKCGTCARLNAVCEYEPTPARRVNKDEQIAELIKRVEGMEQAMRKGSTIETSPIQPSSKRSQFAARQTDLPDELQNYPPMDEYMLNLVDVYFRNMGDWSLTFMHEGMFRTKMREQTLPKHLLYAVCAASLKYQSLDTQSELNEVRRFIQSARKELLSDDASLEIIQTHLLLSIANYSIGDGRDSWRELGTAILLAVESGLYSEVSLNKSPVEKELCRRIFWTCFTLDRFLACGSARPMLIRDEDIFLRLPCPDENFRVSVTDEASFFSPNSFRSSTSSLGRISSEMAYIGIISILGSATSYLQTGGVRGDTHFPWHANSKLATLRSELAAWHSSVSRQYQGPDTKSLDESQQQMLFLAMQIYHLIHCLLLREFLPIDYQVENIVGTSPANWQAETIEQCISHANEIAHSLQTSQSQVALLPPFIGFCVFVAATVHLHGWHWNIPNISTKSKEYLTYELRTLLEMKKHWAGLDNLGDCIRYIYSAHIKLMNSPQHMDSSGIFENNGFMGRYSQHVDNLDSSFCKIAAQQPDVRTVSTSEPQNVRSPSMGLSAMVEQMMPAISPPPPLPQMQFFETQPQSYIEQLMSPFPERSSTSLDLFDISQNPPFGSVNQGCNQVDFDRPNMPSDDSLGGIRPAEDMEMGDPVLNSLQTLAEAGTNLGEPQDFNFNVWDWFASQEKNVL